MSAAGERERPSDAIDRLEGEITELRRSRRRLVTGADADRRALERALHDGVQQDLVALLANTRLADGLIERDPAAAHELLEELGAIARHALDEATSLAEAIHPALLEVRGLAGALRVAAERAGVTADVDVGISRTHAPETLGALYWCGFEALTAAPPGSEVSISLSEAGGDVTLEVGYPGGYTEERLARFRDRVEALGGRITVHEGSDGASGVRATLPRSA